METTPAIDDKVIDAIADIERLRLATAKEAGIAMACSTALHRLHELLDHEREALRLRGPASGHLVNVEAVRTEIGRVKELNTARRQNRIGGNAYPGQHKASWRDAAIGPVKSKGRRTIGGR